MLAKEPSRPFRRNAVKPDSSGRGTIALAAIGLAALTLTSCGPTASSQSTQSSANEEELRTIVANDRQQIEALQQQLARENDRIAELEHNNPQGGSSDNIAALEARLNKLEGKNATTPQASPSESPSPAAEASPAASASPEGAPTVAANASPGASPSPAENDNDENAETPAAAPTNLAAAESPAAASTAAASQPEAATAPTWQAADAHELASTQNDPAAKLYRAGLASMKSGNYKDAAAKFDDLQRRYPKSELSGPAEYFAGNARYEMGQYEKAILQFNDLSSRFPEGRYTTAALLREAEAFTKINDPIDARLTLQKLVNEHPNAPEVAQAKAMLDSLSQSAGN